MKESVLQRQTIAHLQKMGYLVNKITLCSMNGWPDLEAHRKGKTIFIEVKTTSTKTNPLQDFRHAQIRKDGFFIFVIHSIADLALLQ